MVKYYSPLFQEKSPQASLLNNSIVMNAYSPEFVISISYALSINFLKSPPELKNSITTNENRKSYSVLSMGVFSWTKNGNYLYCLRMREGNVFILSVCLLCVCLSVQVITFECLDIETSFWYGDTH